jgi:glucokinase
MELLSKTVIACDVGGTHLRIAVVDESLALTHQEKHSIRGLEYHEIITKTVTAITEKAAQFSDVRGIGLAMAGSTDVEAGTVTYRKVEDDDPHAADWLYETLPIARDIEQAVGKPVVLESDGNAACLGEWHAGAAKGWHNVVSLTLGTYVASGVVLRNSLLHRRHGGPMLGPIISRYGDGYDFAGLFCCGVGLAREARRRLHKNLNGKELHALAMSGDKTAQAIFQETGEWLGVVVASSINIFDPEVVVLNGPVMHAADLLLPAAQTVVSKWGLPDAGSQMPAIRVGDHLETAALIGVAKQVLDSL